MFVVVFVAAFAAVNLARARQISTEITARRTTRCGLIAATGGLAGIASFWRGRVGGAESCRNGETWRAYTSGRTQEWIAARHGIDQSQVSPILTEVRTTLPEDAREVDGLWPWTPWAICTPR